jgi:predicted TIM-barrel fold metal-dependent hydrolase
VPFRLPKRAVAEMQFGKEHGALGVHLRGARHGYGLGDPVYTPVYAAGRDLDLVMAVHSGGDGRIMREQPSLVFLNNLAPVPGAFHSVLDGGLPRRFPGLRWGFLEAGASWLPFAIQQAMRVDTEASAGAVSNLRQVRGFHEWRDRTRGLLGELDLYVACEIDDDLVYLDGFVGGSNLVHGTDYGHMDMGSDPYGLHIVDRRSDVDAATRRAIVDSNARRLWGVDPGFTPAPPLAPGWEVPSMRPMPNWFSVR